MAKVKELLDDDYRISSSTCGTTNSEAYDFAEFWQAILIKQDNEPKFANMRGSDGAISSLTEEQDFCCRGKCSFPESERKANREEG